jgi:hypothetical protein
MTAASGPAAPAQVLGGDCAALYSDALVSEVLGTPVTARQPFVDAPNALAVPTLGGLHCEWAAADLAETTASVTAVVLSTAVNDDAGESVTCSTGEVAAHVVDASACAFSFVGNDLWLSGTVYPQAGGTDSEVRAAVATLEQAFRALPATAVIDPALHPAAWTPPSCAELSDTAEVAATLGRPGLVGANLGTSGPESAPGVEAANAGARVFACAWYDEGATPAVDAGLSVQGLPGGAWAQTTVLAQPGAQVMSIPGVELAVRVPTAEGHDLVDVFDGVNWLQVAVVGSLDPVLPVVPRLIDALNGETVR